MAILHCFVKLLTYDYLHVIVGYVLDQALEELTRACDIGDIALHED